MDREKIFSTGIQVVVAEREGNRMSFRNNGILTAAWRRLAEQSNRSVGYEEGGTLMSLNFYGDRNVTQQRRGSSTEQHIFYFYLLWFYVVRTFVSVLRLFQQLIHNLRKLYLIDKRLNIHFWAGCTERKAKWLPSFAYPTPSNKLRGENKTSVYRLGSCSRRTIIPSVTFAYNKVRDFHR